MPKWIWLRKNGLKNVPNTKLRSVIENPNPIPYAVIRIPIIARNGPKTKMRLKKPREIAEMMAAKRFLVEGLFSASFIL